MNIDAAITKMAEFMAITGFPYRPNKKIEEEFLNLVNRDITRLVMESKKDKLGGYHQPLSYSLEIPRWGIIANQFSIPFHFDKRLLPIFNFEFYHFDYENVLRYNRPLDAFPTLDVIYAAQLYGFANKLRKKQPKNPYYKRCHERPSRKVTKEDIKKYIKEEDRELAFLILKHPDKGVDMPFFTPDGTIPYLINAPEPPRKLHTFKEIKGYLQKGVEDIANEYCKKEEYNRAVKLLCQRNRVKDFLGSDVEIPKSLIARHKEYYGNFDLEEMKRRIKKRVCSYNPRSLSYGLDIPENFTLAEYCFFRYILI